MADTEQQYDSGFHDYKDLTRGGATLFLHAPPSALACAPVCLPAAQHQTSMPGAGVEGPGAGDGGQVMIHWTQSGPSVQPSSDRGGHRSTDNDDDDPDEEDDELLVPAPPRERLSYTRYQLELLNGIFGSVRYPNSVQKQLIAKRVGISREQVKIWFQNRRRKDVVMSKTTSSFDSSSPPSSTQGPASPSTSTTSSPPTHLKEALGDGSNSQGEASQNSDMGGGTEGQESQKSRMVPDAVINGCIAELKRFSDEKLKERKEKRKAKGKRRAHSSSSSSRSAQSGGQGGAKGSNQSVNRLFQAYDMVAPPNKVTPTAAFLDISANHFNHSHNSSAFSSPRDHLAAASSMPRLAWDTADTGLTPSLAGSVTDQLAHSRGYGGLGMAGLGMGVLPTNQTQAAGVPGSPDSLPVLSDLLTYRQQVDPNSSSRDSREASLPQASLLSSSSPSRDPGKLLDYCPTHSSSMTVPPSPLPVNRVYPFPFIADPPIMLSNLHQHDSLHHTPHWPHPHPAQPSAPSAYFGSVTAMNGTDPYKPVMISSLGNPYFSSPSAPNPWSSHSGMDPTSGAGFTQL